ncbi:receptor-like protein 7 [Actinidia eriantha]|uniref:receptor-like protein 7 n=1 Tax=Actinidia eriantha TaxID=165200 RepID=UPI00258989C2|nr:receptor-like protein 7 [Actinidia eriantha]
MVVAIPQLLRCLSYGCFWFSQYRPMKILQLQGLFLIILFTALFGINTISISGKCLDDQKSLLLQLKNSLIFESTISVRLVNWTQAIDCCGWKGVNCDLNGRVTGLDLNSELISGGINQSSLFRLQFLESLNLAYNSFKSEQIPPSLGNLTSLRYLNLSNAGFVGQIPTELSLLTRLVVLDLSSFHFPGTPSLQLENPNLVTFLRNLPGVIELYLDGVNISASGSEWCQAISSSVPNLQVLSLSNCYLSGPMDVSLQKLRFLSEINLGSNNLSAPVPEFFANFRNLTALILSSSNLNGAFPEKIFQVPTLQTLDLENNRFIDGSLPEFPKNSNLQKLVLSGTNFSGRLPDSMGNLTKLSRMEIAGCNFSGMIPSSMANLTQLAYVDMRFNKFTGPIPSFQMSKNLSYIDLSHNNLAGPVSPTHFQGLSNLVNIDLAYNSFSGSIPASLFTLPSLKKIQLSYNQFNSLSGSPNVSLSPLDTLDLNSNKLVGPIPPYFFDFLSLSVLSLSFNNFSGILHLESITRLQNLTRLELSYNSLSINVSESSLSSFPKLSILKLASCKMQKFPPLWTQNKMIHLDLSANQIWGGIPNWIWKVGNGTLAYLNLSCNHLVDLERQYAIPHSLSVLDLHLNQLRGEIPAPPLDAIYVDYSNNNFSSSIPAEIGNNLIYATFFSVSNNMLTGAIPQSICNASFIQVLDLSNNRFNGIIPQCLIETNTATLGVLNLRSNNLSGAITGTFPQGCALKTLDLNGNRLEGQFPGSLAKCTKLEVLNVGNNNIRDSFPCFLKNSSTLRVLVLRSNKFQGGIGCPGVINNTWPKLQIIDLALNNFSGDLPPNCFLRWKAMQVDMGTAQPDLNHLGFEFLMLNHFYYQDTVTVTMKGLGMELVKILTVFTSVDFSCNNFTGEVPDTVGALQSLYVLNFSHNALAGGIPSSLGNLSQLESLDLSCNKLSGSIPVDLASLNFLSFLNLSYNQLVGLIPRSTQLQSFSETSFEGNEGLCGSPLNTSCSNSSTPPSSNKSDSVSRTVFDWKFIYTGLGFGIGAGFVVGPLVFWKKLSHWCDEHIERFVRMILPTLGFLFPCCNDLKDEAEDNVDEVSSDEDYDEMEDQAFQGRYCVFCSKLDIYRKKAIHNPKCLCHDLPPISSSSTSSSSPPSE